VLTELPEFEHLDVTSVAEAVRSLNKHGKSAKLIAGGSDLLGLMKDRITGSAMPLPQVLINIKPVSQLSLIEYDEGRQVRIGATATLFDIERHPAVRARFAALAQAAASVGTAQIRSVGTLGGNLCQRPWCSYFRHPQFDCFKKGGRQCYAITGHNRYYFSYTALGVCVMSHPSDLAPALVALGARVVVAGTSGERVIPVSEFFHGGRSLPETVLADDEMVERVEIDEPAQTLNSVYMKKRLRGSWDFALSSVAASMTRFGSACEDVRIVLGGVAPAPFRATAAESLLRGKEITDELIEAAAAAAVPKPRPLRMNAYKVGLTTALVKRAVQAVAAA
jgi:xanthine dehydrogenase YagS FAD-binding subunit